jgi:hypothetical protein
MNGNSMDPRPHMALETLMQAAHLNLGDARSLAVLAMTQHASGQKDQAQATLGRLREIMMILYWAKNEEAQAFLREAEAVLKEP